MAIAVQCQSCGGQFRAAERDRGNSAPCTRCGVELRIEGPAVPDYDVFVSHSSKDKTAADAVVAALESAKIRCWVAPRDITPSADWSAAIIDAIGNCRVMVLLYTQHSNQSRQVQNEVERAFSKGLAIIPLRLEATVPSKTMEYFISRAHWLDAMTPPLEKHLAYLVGTVRGIVGQDFEGSSPPNPAGTTVPPVLAPPPRVPEKVPPPSRRLSRAGLFVALLSLIAIAAAGWMFHGDKALKLKENFDAYLTKNYANTLGMKFIRIEPGEFDMGSPTAEAGRFDNETLHHVKLTKPFMMAIHHVTRGQFAAFINGDSYKTDAEKEGFAYVLTGEKLDKVNGASWRNPGFNQTDDHPVVEVSWNDATAFCKWLSKKEQKRYRLPTEAEWEYACRGGSQKAYFWGDDSDAGQGYANCADLTAKDIFPDWNVFKWRDGFVFTSPVGSFKPNKFGLYDMIGNAWEWCSDYYGVYPAGDAVDPTGPATGDASASRVLRGASWFNPPRSCRSAFHGRNSPDFRNFDFGFRICLDF